MSTLPGAGFRLFTAGWAQPGRRFGRSRASPTTRAGTPTTTACGGTSRVTTAPAPTRAPSRGVPQGQARRGGRLLAVRS